MLHKFIIIMPVLRAVSYTPFKTLPSPYIKGVPCTPFINVPLFALLRCQSKARIKDEGDSNDPYYHTVSLNFTYMYIHQY